MYFFKIHYKNVLKWMINLLITANFHLYFLHPNNLMSNTTEMLIYTTIIQQSLSGTIFSLRNSFNRNTCLCFLNNTFNCLYFYEFVLWYSGFRWDYKHGVQHLLRQVTGDSTAIMHVGLISKHMTWTRWATNKHCCQAFLNQ